MSDEKNNGDKSGGRQLFTDDDESFHFMRIFNDVVRTLHTLAQSRPFTDCFIICGKKAFVAAELLLPHINKEYPTVIRAQKDENLEDWYIGCEIFSTPVPDIQTITIEPDIALPPKAHKERRKKWDSTYPRGRRQ